MTLKPSQVRFKFPVRIYSTKNLRHREDEDRDDTFYKLTTNQPEETPYVIGVAAVFIDQVSSYVEALTQFENITDWIGKPLPCTHVMLLNDEEYLCSWNVKRFEEEYDKHIEKLNSQGEERTFQTIEIDDNNLPEFEAAIKDYKKRQKLKLKLK